MGVSVSSPESQREAVWAALNEIVDPCSVAMAEPLGIADMGLVQEIAISGDEVEIVLLPTSPHCLHVGLFEQAIEEKLGPMPWVDSVRVRAAEGETIWDESRLTPAARERLAARRAVLRKSLRSAREDQN